MELALLKEAGLTDGEARVYMALLESGPSTTGKVVDRAKISHSIIYKILDSLVRKGLAAYVTKENVKHYSAANPHKLSDIMKERQEQMEDSRRKLEKILPDWQNLAKTKETEVRVFFGFRAMQGVHEHMYEKLKRGEGFFYLGILPQQPEHLHSYWKRDHMRRAKAGIISQALFNRKTDASVLRNRNKYAHSDARYMPVDINTPAWIMGYKDVTVIGLESKEIITIEIVNGQIADSFRAYFEAFWKNSKPFAKK